MAIEVDFSAWEKWRPSKEFLGSLVHTNAARLGFAGNDSYIQNGIVIASVCYIRDLFVPACYIFLAEDESLPITKLVRFAWFNWKLSEGFRYLDEIDVDEQTAQEFHEDFLKLPTPKPAMIEYFLSERDGYDFQVDLGRIYGEKSYVGGSDFSHFYFDNTETYRTFYASFDRIIQRCQALTAHRHPNTKAIQEAIKAYEAAHRSKAESVKTYKGIKAKKPKVLSSTKKLLEDYRSSNMKMQENFLDFKHYLPRFLEFISFDRQSGAEHETILFGNLKKIDFLTWDEDERKPIFAYFLALFKYSLSYYPSITVPISILMLWIIKLEIDLASFLSYWEISLIHVDSLRHLGAFLEKLIEENLTDTLPESLVSWLRQANLEKALEDTIALYKGKRPYAHEFAEALENLRLIRS